MVDPIEKYDQELEQDISSLKKYVDEDEELAKAEFQNLGCPKETIEDIATKERAKGKHMYFDLPACMGSDELLAELKELLQSIKISSFRIYLCSPRTLR